MVGEVSFVSLPSNLSLSLSLSKAQSFEAVGVTRPQVDDEHHGYRTNDVESAAKCRLPAPAVLLVTACMMPTL